MKRLGMSLLVDLKQIQMDSGRHRLINPWRNRFILVDLIALKEIQPWKYVSLQSLLPYRYNHTNIFSVTLHIN